MPLILPKLEARSTIGSLSLGVSVDGAPFVFVPAGEYFWETAASMPSNLRTAFRALLIASVPGAQVSIADSTGVMQINWGGGAHSITWSSTAAQALCGFIGVPNPTPPGLVLTGTEQVQALWLPNKPPADLLFPLASAGKPACDRTKTRARSGKVWTTGHNRWIEQRLTFVGLTANKVARARETIKNESYESLWQSYLSRGHAFRLYLDRTDDTSYIAHDGMKRDYFDASDELDSEAMRRNFDGLWTLRLTLWGYT